MITYLKGVLAAKSAPWVTVDVGGVGYAVEVSLSTLAAMPAVGEVVHVHTELVVREDAQLLYGFATEEEKSTFQTLVKINGVGAKMALAVLSSFTAENLAQVVQAGDVATLTTVPGVGKKTAERLIVELKDKLSAFEGAANQSLAHAGSKEQEAIAALEALGYKANEAAQRVKQAAAQTDEASVEALIRQALRR